MQSKGGKKCYMNPKKGMWCSLLPKRFATTIMLWARSNCLCVGIQNCRSVIDSLTVKLSKVHQILCFADKTGGIGKEYTYLHVLLTL